MAILRERTDLDKKPIWYLFLAANVVVLLGCAITWIICTRPNLNFKTILIPSVVCNIVALLMCGLFIWFEAKTTMPKAVHFQRKWLYWYLAALIVFVVAIIFNFIYIFIYMGNIKPTDRRQWSLIIYFVITGVLTLVSIGLQRYARYKIDLDIYRRTHGELPKKEEMEKDKAKLEKQETKDSQMPSSGLADSIDKQ